MAAPKYKGILAQPMQSGDPAGADAYWQRVEALFGYYGIDMGKEGAGFTLALALAQDHVPGFKFESPKLKLRKAGRDLALFGLMVEKINGGHSESRAAELVVKQHPELNFKSPQAARQRFLNLKNLRSETGRDGSRAKMWTLFYALSQEKL
jgi:hypothetical protein